MKRNLLILTVLFCSLMTTATRAEISLAALLDEHAVISIGPEYRLLKVGETSPEGVTLTQVTEQAAWLSVNGKEQRYTLKSTLGTSPAPKKIISIDPDERGLYLVEGSINGKRVVFMIDTGASHITMNIDQADLLGIDYQSQGLPVVVDTASGQAKAYSLRLTEAGIDDIKVQNPAALVIEGTWPQTTLLGMSFLQEVIMCNKGKVLQLQK